ncbi:SUPPRESSOR OF npr1-1 CONSTITUTIVE 1 protein [Nymphaea thermarum]|nr:SUPPRESSOR OF npr1-1 CONSTITUTIVE 1 protein [Nymphaea thermarum]
MHDQIRDMGRKIIEDEKKEGKSCSRLWNIPKVIQTLQKPRVRCKKLEKLPDTISDLTSLEFFSLYGCSDLLYLPKQLGNMPCLRNLDLRTKSEHIKSLSSSIRKLDRLEQLHMDYDIGAGEGDTVAESKLFLKSAYFLDALPDPCCRSKTHLYLHDHTIKELMASFIRWENLESLILYCTSLKSLPASVGQLQKLKVLEVYCNKLILVDDALPLKSIERLVMPKKLKTLELSAKQITVTPDFSFAPHLEELTLIDCEMLTEVHESVGTLVNLKSLKITGCNALEGLPEAICHLTSLKSLELRQYVGCCSVGLEIIRLETRIKSILSSLEQLTKLEKVCIYKHLGGTNVKRIEFEMFTLEISGLSLECVTSLWSSVYVIHSVKTLVIVNDQIEELPDSIAQVQNLEHLKFECGSLKAVPNWIGQLNRLHTFQPKFGRWRYPTQPEWIGGLQKLSLRGCQNIKHLPDIVGQMERLKWLDLWGSGIIELPPWLGCLTNLTHLNLSTAHQNSDVLPELAYLTSLKELHLSGRNFGSSLSCISNFPRLRVLNGAPFRYLRTFKMEGNIIAGSHSVDIQVITKDDLVLFKTTLPENDFDDGYKTFSFKNGDGEILEHLREGSRIIQVSTDVSELSRVDLKAVFG